MGSGQRDSYDRAYEEFYNAKINKLENRTTPEILKMMEDTLGVLTTLSMSDKISLPRLYWHSLESAREELKKFLNEGL